MSLYAAKRALILLSLLLILNVVIAFQVVSRTVGIQKRKSCSDSDQQIVRRSYIGMSALYGKRSLIEELNDIENESGDGDAESSMKDIDKPIKKEKIKLEPEVTFFEGGPDISEIVIPTISILTVIGIIPFAAAVARQAWVKYTITSRRIRVVSGLNGKDETEVVYPDIKRMVYVYRFFGRCGDIVMELRDGSKLELRSMPNFEENYKYILEKTTSQCQELSDKLKAKET